MKIITKFEKKIRRREIEKLEARKLLKNFLAEKYIGMFKFELRCKIKCRNLEVRLIVHHDKIYSCILYIVTRYVVLFKLRFLS